MDALYVGAGVILGAIITWHARNFEIGKALSTVGIRRKEHVAHRKQTEKMEDDIKALKERVRVLAANRTSVG
jgi:hypothetical protein